MLDLYESKYKNLRIKSLKGNNTTGGDTGSALEGLRDMYYHPETYDILPYRHNYTATGETALTAYFIPAFTVVNTPECMDSRGYTDPEKGKEYYNKERDKKSASPKALLKYCAEYCFNAEEAFSLEGDNKFNKVNITEQLTKIRILKTGPKPEAGSFRFNYMSGTDHKMYHVSGVQWIPDKNEKVQIIEHPLWDRSPGIDEETGEPIPVIEKMAGLYVIGIDGIDIGAGQTSENTKDPSDFCLIVKKRAYGLQDPKPVAYYKDRPLNLRKAYQTAFALAMYYNAKINIEATRMSLVTWARENKCLNWFMHRPSATYADITKKKSTQYGSPATITVINHYIDLIADYIEDYSHCIWFEEMLDQANRYDYASKRKFDIIAAWGMAELADEELGGITPKLVIPPEEDLLVDIGYYYDENGYKRFGVIPKLNNLFPINLNINVERDDGRTILTSNPEFLY